MENCKACRFTSAIHKETIEKELARLGETPDILADDDTRKQRLETCSDCRHLDQTGTCMMCGCYVMLRSAIKKNKCPKKYW